MWVFWVSPIKHKLQSKHEFRDLSQPNSCLGWFKEPGYTFVYTSCIPWLFDEYRSAAQHRSIFHLKDGAVCCTRRDEVSINAIYETQVSYFSCLPPPQVFYMYTSNNKEDSFVNEQTSISMSNSSVLQWQEWESEVKASLIFQIIFHSSYQKSLHLYLPCALPSKL